MAKENNGKTKPILIGAAVVIIVAIAILAFALPHRQRK